MTAKESLIENLIESLIPSIPERDSGEITTITVRKPRGSMRFSRRPKVLIYIEIEREERDSIIYLTTPRTPAYMPPACAYARGGGFLVRFSFRYYQEPSADDASGNSRVHRESLFYLSGFPAQPQTPMEMEL